MQLRTLRDQPGHQAAASLFGQFPGRWTVRQLPNPAATAFWRKAIRCPFQEREQGPEVVQSFTAGARSDIRLPRSLSRKSGKFVFWRRRRQNGAMPSVQIKNVPERTHAILRQRAAAAHQSLQEYLRARLIEEADQPTLEEVLDRAGGRSGGSVPLEDAAAAVRDDRDRR